jgi:hypothetical protein
MSDGIMNPGLSPEQSQRLKEQHKELEVLAQEVIDSLAPKPTRWDKMAQSLHKIFNSLTFR